MLKLANLGNIYSKLIDGVSNMISDAEARLINHLKQDVRASISELARKLNISRATVQARIAKLEKLGVIKAYTLELGKDYLQAFITAHVLIAVQQKLSSQVTAELLRIEQVSQIHAISGDYDVIAVIQAKNTEMLSHILDDIAMLDGVERTNSSVILETKTNRL